MEQHGKVLTARTMHHLLPRSTTKISDTAAYIAKFSGSLAYHLLFMREKRSSYQLEYSILRPVMKHSLHYTIAESGKILLWK